MSLASWFLSLCVTRNVRTQVSIALVDYADLTSEAPMLKNIRLCQCDR